MSAERRKAAVSDYSNGRQERMDLCSIKGDVFVTISTARKNTFPKGGLDINSVVTGWVRSDRSWGIGAGRPFVRNLEV